MNCKRNQVKGWFFSFKQQNSLRMFDNIVASLQPVESWAYLRVRASSWCVCQSVQDLQHGPSISHVPGKILFLLWLYIVWS